MLHFIPPDGCFQGGRCAKVKLLRIILILFVFFSGLVTDSKKGLGIRTSAFSAGYIEQHKNNKQYTHLFASLLLTMNIYHIFF